VIKEDPSRWDALVGQALPVVEYYLQSVISRYDLESPKDKAAAAREVLPLIEEIDSSVERSHYLQRLARMLRVDERVLQQEAQSKRSARGKPLAPSERSGRLSAQPGLMFGLERYVLMLLVKHPELLASMNDLLVGLELEPLTGEDLTGVEERALFEWITAYIAAHDAVSVDVLHQEVDPALRQIFDSVLSLMEEVPLLPDEQAQLDAARRALRLRELNLLRRIEELRYLLEDARAQGDADEAKQLEQMVNELVIQLDRVQKAKAAQTALRNLRPEAPRR
jgi:DNA primase